MVNVELELAIELIADSIRTITDVEEVNIEEARGRLLAQNIYAPINQPPFNRSPLDGYAIRAKDTTNCSKTNPVRLKVIDEICAGESTKNIVGEKEAIRIMTGAKIPEGADCVIKQENTDYGMESVEIYEELKEYDNYCFEGEDIKKGSKLINQGEKLNYIHIGILASMGYEKVYVKRKPNVAIISTGDELIPLGQPLSEGKIYDSNRRMIKGRLLDYGCNVIKSYVVYDDEIKIAKIIDGLIDSVDLIVTTGGVSVGKKDLLHVVVDILGGERIFWRVNIKPGTPALYAKYKDKPLLCLSGNPFAAIATFELLGSGLLYKLTGDHELKQVRKISVIEDNFLKPSKKRRIIRGIYEDNKVYLSKGGHSSGMLYSMIGCNCLIDIKPNTEKLLKGDKVEIILLK